MPAQSPHPAPLRSESILALAPSAPRSAASLLEPCGSQFLAADSSPTAIALHTAPRSPSKSRALQKTRPGIDPTAGLTFSARRPVAWFERCRARPPAPPDETLNASRPPPECHPS